MDTYVLLILGLVVGLVAGVAVGWAIASSRAAAKQPANKDELVARLEAQIAEHGRRDAEEQKLLVAIAPLAQKMATLEAEVRAKEEKATTAFAEIRTQLDAAKNTDAQLRNQTAALANALSKPGGKGSWGELTLERLLESLGMLPNVDFLKKEKLEADEEDPQKKKRFPDVVIRLPKDRYIAVDSKVPYTNYLAAMDEEDSVSDGNFAKRDALLKTYIGDIKSQVDTLAEKNYYNGLVSSPEFTVMYMPNEPALSVALRVEPALMEYAFARKIVLVTPSSFFSVIKTVSHIWSRSEDEKTVNEILTVGQKMLTQVRLLAGEVWQLRKGLHDSVDSFNSMVKRLNKTFIEPVRTLGEHAALAQAAGEIKVSGEINEQLNEPNAPEYRQIEP